MAVQDLNCLDLSLARLKLQLGNFHYILTLKPDSKQFCKENVVFWLVSKRGEIKIFLDFYAYNMTLPRIKVKGFCLKVLLRRPLKAT